MWSSQATLNPLNISGTSGEAVVGLHGAQATVTMNVSGAAETFMDGPFSHAEHIHSSEQAATECPLAFAETDGVVNTCERQPSYGGVLTSPTTDGDTSPGSALAVERFPGSGAYTYEPTIELDAATKAAVEDGTAVVVVHSVDLALLPAAAAEKMGPLNSDLPLAATLPAACGVLSATQMGAVPRGTLTPVSRSPLTPAMPEPRSWLAPPRWPADAPPVPAERAPAGPTRVSP